MITDKDKALACLPQLNPMRCDDYHEWVQVGMALKVSGCSCEDWDTWSRGSAKWKAGECEKKWNTFKGASFGDIGTGTLIKMMREDGGTLDKLFESHKGVTFGWDEPIPVGHTEQPASPTPDMTDAPVSDLITYLKAMFRPDECVGYVTESWKAEDGRWLPKKGTYGRTAGQIIEALEKHPDDIANAVGDWEPDAGAWIRVNPLDGKGVKNENVTEYRHVLVESDRMPIDDQIALLKSSRLPITCLVHSGGKSVHALVKVDAGKDYKLYRERVDKIFAYLASKGFEVDTQCRNPSRLSRMPSITRAGVLQHLAGQNMGLASYSAWEASLSAIQAPDPINVRLWLDKELEAPDQIIFNTLDAGDKLVLIAPSKQRKSFFFMQLMLSIATGRQFLAWTMPKKRRVLVVQFEVRANHYHRRVKRMCTDLTIREELADNLYILNCRGVDIEAVYQAVEACAEWFKPELIGFDPFYKMHSGDENSAQDIKPVLQRFDALAEKTKAAIAYVHHDAKGMSGERNIRDRGAGSNVVGRDYDVCFTITPHEDDENMSVVDVLLRNYAPQYPATVKWGGHYFELLENVKPVAKSPKGSRGRPKQPEASWYSDQAMEAIGGKVYQRGVLKDMLATRLDVPQSKAHAIITVLEESGQIHKHTSSGFPRKTYFGTAEAIKEAAKPVQEEVSL